MSDLMLLFSAAARARICVQRLSDCLFTSSYRPESRLFCANGRPGEGA
jgi:hypothetical protein